MSIFQGSSGTQYNLAEKPLATGGEGAIYAIITAPGKVAKVYHSANSSLERKISIMVDRPPSPKVAAQMAWPIDVLRDGTGKFCGFVMNKLDTTHELLELYKYPPMEYEGITLQHKLVIAQNICTVIAGVHSAGYIFGDFNPMNIGVNLKTGSVAFFDTDSYHIRDPKTNSVFRCNVCLPGYVAPELISACKRFKAANPNEKDVYAKMPLPTFSKETDNFALAIHIFKLLMNGYSPFNGIDARVTVSQASPGLGDVAVERDNYCFKPGVKPQSVATPALSTLPKQIQDLFQRAFIEGRTSPSRRPTADEWYIALEQYEKDLCQCQKDHNHFYYKGLSTCPWCKAKRDYEDSLRIAASSNGNRSTTPVPMPPPGSGTYTYNNPSAAANSTPTIVQPQTVWQKPETFWAVTLIGSAIISGILLYICGLTVFGSGNSANDLQEGIQGFLDMIAPFILFAGGIAGTIFYNVKYGKKYTNCYSGKNYALSLLMSPAGMVAAYVAILIAMLALYLLAVVAVFAIVIGIFSGG